MTEDVKHTAGPWEYVPGTEHHGPYVTHAFGGTVADCYMMSRPGPLNHEPAHPVPFMAEMAEANARLIAAAPELLAVLTAAGGVSPEELDDAADIVEGENGYLARQLRGAANAARAAIALATSQPTQ